MWVCCAMVFAVSLIEPAPAAPPKLTALYPPGAARGSTVPVTASGTFSSWPVSIWVDRPGVTVKAGTEQGKLEVSVAPDAEPGIYWIRLYDAEGSTAVRPFVVGSIPEILESEPNDDRLKPHAVSTLPAVVNGRLEKANDIDTYAVTLRAGDTFVASVEANRTIGSPMDTIVQLVSPDGFVLGENDDYHDMDSQHVQKIAADGVYLVRIFGFPAVPTASIGFAGGEDFIYRLTMTAGPFIEHAYPLSVTRPSPDTPPIHVNLHGWNIPEESRKYSPPMNKASESSELIEIAPDGMAGRAIVRIEPLRTTTEQTESDSAQKIEVPVAITGRIAKRSEVDTYKFQAKKGEPLLFRAEARGLGFPLDPTIRVADTAGKPLADVDDSAAGRDCELAFTPPSDGEFHLIIRDLHAMGGDFYVYRLVARKVESGYGLKLATDSFTVAAGKTVDVPVTVERTGGFADEIEIQAEGLPDGVTAMPVKSGTGDSAKAVKLTLTATKGPASGPFRIIGRVAGKPELDRSAAMPLPNFTSAISSFWLTVTPAN